MDRTTVYSDELKSAETVSEAVAQPTFVKFPVRQLAQTKQARRGGVIRGGEPIAEHVDDYLKDFGQ